MFATPSLVFLHVPKTAGVSVADYLRRALGAPVPSRAFHAGHAGIPASCASLYRYCQSQPLLSRGRRASPWGSPRPCGGF